MSDFKDRLGNRSDPLLKSSSEQQLELFKKLTKECSGQSAEAVIGAAINLLINAVRQAYPNLREAGARYDEVAGRGRQSLTEHYDGVTGKRRGIFAHDQVIAPPMLTDADRVHRKN